MNEKEKKKKKEEKSEERRGEEQRELSVALGLNFRKDRTRAKERERERERERMERTGEDRRHNIKEQNSLASSTRHRRNSGEEVNRKERSVISPTSFTLSIYFTHSFASASFLPFGGPRGEIAKTNQINRQRAHRIIMTA